jgi:MoaA/NifB/PqqE/SkfB family radical SAM enzyme
MSVREAKQYLQQATRLGVDILCVSGGEPLLFFDAVAKIAQEAKRLGMQSIWVFSNAHWAVSLEAARRRLIQLKRAGVSRLCLSADGFHQQFIPTQSVHDAMIVASDLGMEVVLDTRIMGKTLQENNPVNKATVEILQQLGDLRNIETWRGSPMYIGRAAETLPQALGTEPMYLDGPCLGPWGGGTWINPVGVDVDLYGEVTLCPGISIGNARIHSLSKILTDYEPSQHRIIREITAGGPKGLWRMALESGYKSLAGYLSACHLCYDVRKFIRSGYPAELAPISCYEELC